MQRLPDGFADSLARVIDRRDHESAAEVIAAATMLDDEGLKRFLAMFAQRVRESNAPIRAEELRRFVQRAARARRRDSL